MPTKLNGLELQGYKTFANKNTFLFSDKITAIVGPNGSGKSNVADAIRWVLGEQSFSLLRARKTEDMIFSGSERRPRAGMASATITFNNETQWLPIDYSEVSITRRAYRDGQNEYLLNGTRVRLRDINELLARAGLAERTYTVIGQGLVDSALSLRPEERRRFFEEAAGIQLYRSRQEEAKNRLVTTRRNMDRVYDILNEIKPRLRSLERQARKVEEHDRITADLQLLLREWYGYHWHATQHEIQKAQEIYTTRTKYLTQAREKQSVCDLQLQKARTEIRELRDQLSEWHNESSKLHQTRESESKEAAVLEERKKSMVQQEAELKRQIAELEEQLKVQQERASTAQDALEEKGVELFDTQDKAIEEKEKLEVRLEERKKLQRLIEKKRTEIYRFDTAELKTNAKKSELIQRMGEYELSIKEQETQIAVLEEELKQERQGLDALEKKRDELSQKKSELNQMTVEHSQRLDEKNAAVAEIQQLMGEKKIERTTAEASLRYMEDAESSFMGLSQGSANLLQNSKKGRFSSEISALSSYLEVPEAHEQAVASFLGERIHAVMVENDASLDEILKYLASGSFGRTVLATAVSRSKKVVKTDTMAGAVGYMLDLVSFPEKFSNIFQSLFTDVVIVEDRHSAQQLVKKYDNITWVTKTGEIFYPDGVVVAGSESNKSGIISRPREKRELNEKIKTLKKEEERLSNELAVEEHKRESIQTILHDLNADLENLQTKLSAHERELFQQTVAFEQTSRNLDAIQKQIGDLQNRIVRSSKEIEELEQKLVEISSQRIKEETAIEEADEQLIALPADELESSVNHWQTNAAVLRQAVQSLKTRSSEAAAVVLQTENQLKAAKVRVEHHVVDYETLQAKQVELNSQEHEILAEIEIINAKIQPAEELLRQKEEAMLKLQDEFTSVQQALSVADRNATQAQLSLSREREKLENLREKIEDDFGLVAFEYQEEVAGQEALPLSGWVKQLPVVKELAPSLEPEIKRNRSMLRRLGAINPDAKNEYDDVFERHEFLTQQLDDLTAAEEDLKQVINELNELMKVEFNRTFKAVAAEFKVFFTRLFNGGSARLELTDEDNPTETGIEIHAKLPGRREQNLALLSGGERSLTAVALVFSLLKVSPTPFCILDEVDAMLDESNVGRFCDLLSELGGLGTQFIVITHNRGTVQASDIIYGVTKGTDSASHVVSLKLEEVSDDMVYA